MVLFSLPSIESGLILVYGKTNALNYVRRCYNRNGIIFVFTPELSRLLAIGSLQP